MDSIRFAICNTRKLKLKPQVRAGSRGEGGGEIETPQEQERCLLIA